MQLITRERLDRNDLPLMETYFACVCELIDLPQLQRLDDYCQHLLVSRLTHSVSVSYFSFLICHSLDLNYRAAARGGLLHDLFFDKRGVQQDFDESPWEKGFHAFTHPRQALKNARRIADLTPLEEEIIACHMFPLGRFSLRWEAQIVSMIDKYCATKEFLSSAALWLPKSLLARRRARAVR